jgi:hypothetical protein
MRDQGYAGLRRTKWCSPSAIRDAKHDRYQFRTRGPIGFGQGPRGGHGCAPVVEALVCTKCELTGFAVKGGFGEGSRVGKQTHQNRDSEAPSLTPPRFAIGNGSGEDHSRKEKNEEHQIA